jgi:hypothetical protein
MKTAGWAARLASAASLPLVMSLAPTAFAESVPAGLVLPARGPVAMYIPGAAQLATKRLRRSECLAVLSDFRDGQDHLLKENLESLRMTAPEFLMSLRFVDGSHVALCDRDNVAAVASPGTPVISICTTTFGRLRRDNPGLAANVLIHEMLHALGLGEDPPTSEEITRQVGYRCGF